MSENMLKKPVPAQFSQGCSKLCSHMLLLSWEKDTEAWGERQNFLPLYENDQRALVGASLTCSYKAGRKRGYCIQSRIS